MAFKYLSNTITKALEALAPRGHILTYRRWGISSSGRIIEYERCNNNRCRRRDKCTVNHMRVVAKNLDSLETESWCLDADQILYFTMAALLEPDYSDILSMAFGSFDED